MEKIKTAYDRNWINFEGVIDLFEYLDTKMVTDIRHNSIEYKSETGVDYANITFEVETIHFGLGKKSRYFAVGNLHKINADSLIEKVVNWFE
jgi:hypothetical protein